MPAPRLSECARQVPTSDIATVCCFWCGQRGHFWYDKFEKKRCTNQPKLAKAGGGGYGAQQREQEDKHGRQSSQRDNVLEQDRSALMASPVVPRLAENSARVEARALLAEIAEKAESKEKSQQPRGVWAQNAHGDQRELQKLIDDVKEASKALVAAQNNILALEQKFTAAQLKITAMEKERAEAKKRTGVLRSW